MIQSPLAWVGDRLDRAIHHVGSASDEEYWQEARRVDALTVRRIGLSDLGEALRDGLADFAPHGLSSPVLADSRYVAFPDLFVADSSHSWEVARPERNRAARDG